jgi:hypothetical protein
MTTPRKPLPVETRREAERNNTSIIELFFVAAIILGVLHQVIGW